MAQARKTNNKPIDARLFKINTDPAKNVWAKHKKPIIIVAIIVLLIGWYFSDIWPWPSEERVRGRMNEVLTACSGNEDSDKCKSLQWRFNMTFKYCKSMADYIFLQQKYPNDYLFRSTPYYAMVWEGKTDTPPESSYTVGGVKITSPQNYYMCSDHAK